MFQSLTRAIAQEHELFDWLRTLYPIWSGLNSEAIYVSAKLAMAELMLSGCTTSSDHLYTFPNNSKLDDEIRAAQEIGIRFHAARGAMSVGESKGGLPPDAMVEGEENILIDMRRVIEEFHDAERHAMLRIVVAPCSPFTVSQNLMRESAALARSYGVRLHTHLAETPGDVAYSLEKFGVLPGDYAREIGWVGEDVWHAHCVCLNEREIGLFAQDRDGRLLTVPRRICGSDRGSLRCARCATLKSMSVWASMARRPTTAGICSTRRAWRCCFSAQAAIPPD